jgi:hypothetical protein
MSIQPLEESKIHEKTTPQDTRAPGESQTEGARHQGAL